MNLTHEQKVAILLVALALLFVLLACGDDPTGVSDILNELAEATPAQPYY